MRVEPSLRRLCGDALIRRRVLLAAAITKVVDAQDAGRDTVEIWGSGTALREFLDADHLARFILSVLPRLADLPPPDAMPGIADGVALLAAAIAGGRRIVVVADFDCDGATACAVAVRGLRASISLSISRLRDIARVRAAPMATVIHTSCARVGAPRAARSIPR